VSDPLDRVWREERAAIVATLARRLGDLDLAEDAVQDAFARAAARWPVEGRPDRPGAWLATTAWRAALDRLRATRRRREDAGGIDGAAAQSTLAHEPPDWADDTDLPVADDVLRLLITCCHPALAPEARVALTLRHVAGLTAREIAAAFLVAEATMEKRLVRARAKIRTAGIRFELPDRAAFGERLADVHAVIYLVFTEGYASGGDGPPIRAELCDEAIWLARQVQALTPHDAESTGLLALVLLQRARVDARVASDGSLITYDEQDRTRWDHEAIAQARQLLATTGMGPLGPYQVEAAIALLHAVAPDAERVPWARIAELYAVLLRLAPSPVVAVHRAFAVACAVGPSTGLQLLAPLLDDPLLLRYAPLHVVHGELQWRTGSIEGAAAAWQRAADTSKHPGPRAAVVRRAARAGIALTVRE
jgi:RNA polymerase sigma-70 factor (ECF subfamily)